MILQSIVLGWSKGKNYIPKYCRFIRHWKYHKEYISKRSSKEKYWIYKIRTEWLLWRLRTCFIENQRGSITSLKVTSKKLSKIFGIKYLLLQYDRIFMLKKIQVESFCCKWREKRLFLLWVLVLCYQVSPSRLEMVI
jgi:hypothetical protein